MRRLLSRYTGWLRSLKLGHVFYNLFHLKHLLHNKRIYKKYGISKSVWSSVSSNDFKNMDQEKPWLDRTEHPDLNGKTIAGYEANQIAKDWQENGFLIFPGFFSPEQIAKANGAIEDLVDRKEVHFNFTNRKILFAFLQSQELHDLVADPRLTELLSFLLGRKMRPFQSINFFNGSEQKPHSDSIHMTTFPLGFMAAAWVAMEEVNEQNGPVTYYPGSHKLPYILNDQFDHGGGKFQIGKEANKRYEERIQRLIEEHNLQSESFLAQPGDVLLWHANLIHAGSPIKDKNSTRKSMVAHYFAEDVICYHELTQRPAIVRSR